ncbi:MAG TPA: peptidoglycan DD-metalloendopeptidase family protein [Actinomycetota bacterium]|nr:peptidoglycan DD-metalloendopeptidase family protein [Actinomycetota bacterium]
MHRRGVVAVVSFLALVAGGSVEAHKGPHKRLEAIESKIARTENLIEEAEEERQGLLDELGEADRDREALAEEIQVLNGDLEEARGRLAVVRARLDAARMALIETTEELEETRDRLRDQQRTLDQRAATAYKLGPAVYLDVLLGSDDFRSLADRSAYLQSVLTVDSDLVVGLETTRSLVADQKDTVADVEAQLSEQWDRVHAEVERIAALKAEQQALQSEIEQEISVREGLLEDIEETKAEYEAAVAELQAQSDQIRAVLQSGGSSGSGQVPSGGQLFWPTAGSISSGFGWRTHPIFGTQRFHSGVDIGGACGQPIWAAEDGQVISAGYNGGYGNATVIDHGGGLATLYAHQSSFAVSSGQSVSRGQTIGYVGTTGWSTGCHLHFEVRVNGSPVDPVPYLT